jgi:hypothetical protein
MKLKCGCGYVVDLPGLGAGETFFCVNCGQGYRTLRAQDGKLKAAKLSAPSPEPEEPSEPDYALRDSQLDLDASPAEDEWPEELALETDGQAPDEEEWPQELELEGGPAAEAPPVAPPAPGPARAAVTPVPTVRGPVAEAPAERSSWWPYLVTAWAYPFRGSAKWALLGWCFLHVLSIYTAWLPFLGWVIALGLAGVLAMYQFELIRQSAYDGTAAPSLPGYDDFYESVLRPIGLQLAAIAGSGIPFLVAFMGVRLVAGVGLIGTIEDVSAGTITVWAGVLAAGLLLSLLMFPMNLLAVATADSAAAINPKFTFPAVGRIAVPYLAYCGFYVAVMVGAGALRSLIAQPAESVLLGTFVDDVIGVYTMTVCARALGTLHYAYEDRLGWAE